MDVDGMNADATSCMGVIAYGIFQAIGVPSSVGLATAMVACPDTDGCLAEVEPMP
jgi:hypothetical protein